MSHLTIGRVRHVRDRRAFLAEIEALDIPPVEFTAGEFHLVQSTLTPDGPLYQNLHTFALTGSAAP